MMLKILKLLFFLILTIFVYIEFAEAGQSIAHFSNKAQVRNVGYPLALQWLDSNGQSINKNTPLRIQQNQAASFYLQAYRLDGGTGTPVTASLQIIELGTFEPKGDIALSPAFCQFSPKSQLCNIYLQDIGAPFTDVARQLEYFATDGTSFPAEQKDIVIIANTDGGEVEGIGPDNRANILTAIAVSDWPQQDNVPLELRVVGGQNLQKVHLEFEIENTAIADFNGQKIGICDINFSQPRSTGCDKLIPVTPYIVGKTKINFLLDKSYWQIQGSSVKNKYAQLKPIQVNVGTLFAGYSKARVYRKGSAYTISHLSNSPIRSLAVDQVSHKLYALLPEWTYRQESVTTDLLNLKALAEIPSHNGQVLALTNVVDRILVGAGDAKLYSITDKLPGATIRPLPKMFASVLMSYIDKVTNIAYFTDAKNSLGIYYSNYPTPNKDKFEAINEVIDLNDYGNMLVAANNNVVYAALKRTPALPVVGARSKLFTWVNETMLEVQIAGENPFATAKYISLLMFYHDRLYAGASDGKLYHLKRERDTFSWQLVAETNGEIMDSATDVNGNIYLANGRAGVWKVPFNISGKINPAYKILNYTQDAASETLSANALVIDNNF